VILANDAMTTLLGWPSPQPLASLPVLPLGALGQKALARVSSGRPGESFDEMWSVLDSAQLCRVTLTRMCGSDGEFAFALVHADSMREVQEARERLRALVDVSPDAVLFYLGGVVTHANAAAATLLGAKTIDQLIGTRSVEILHPDSVAAVEQRVRDMVAGTLSLSLLDEKYIRLDGSVIEVESKGVRIPELGEKAFVVVVRDIAERKEAEAQRMREAEAKAEAARAQEQKRWFREIIDMLPSGVYARDSRGTFVLANPAFAHTFGKTSDDVVGKTLLELGVAPDAAEQALSRDRAVLQSGSPNHFIEEVFVNHEGHSRVFATSRVPFMYGDNIAVLCASFDVTEKKALERTLLRTQKLDAIGRLAGGIAHDFNNLLAVIAASAEHLETSLDGNADARLIRDATERAATLTRHLLAFARQTPLAIQPTTLNTLVLNVTQLLARVLGGEIAVVTNLDPKAGDVHVDPTELERVLVNLALNGRDAMAHRGTLTLSTRRVAAPAGATGEWTAVAVRDTGSGISEDVQRHMFEPFFTTKSVGAGVGLGLSTSFGIIELFGGRIELETTPGRGTEISVLLPSAATTSAERTKPVTKPAPRGHETILLVDDDSLVRSVTARGLGSLGYVVLSAGSPHEAMATARTHATPIDLLLTDVLMPEMNGPALALAVREVLPKIRILFFSGYSADALHIEELARFRRVPKLLAKPYSALELGTKVREALDELEESEAFVPGS
jgi:PAS domain S-box-containing protein